MFVRFTYGVSRWNPFNAAWFSVVSGGGRLWPPGQIQLVAVSVWPMTEDTCHIYKVIKEKNKTKPKLWDRDLQNLKYLLFGPSWEKFSDLDFFEFTVIYFSVTFLMGIWMFYRFLAPENPALGFLVHIFMHTRMCVSLGRVTRNKNIHLFKLSRSPPIVFQIGCTTYIPNSSVWEFYLFYILNNT